MFLVLMKKSFGEFTSTATQTTLTIPQELRSGIISYKIRIPSDSTSAFGGLVVGLRACRVVVEVVVAKLDNWWRLFSGKAKFGRIRKTGFGRLHGRNNEKVLNLGFNQFKLSRHIRRLFYLLLLK